MKRTLWLSLLLLGCARVQSELGPPDPLRFVVMEGFSPLADISRVKTQRIPAEENVETSTCGKYLILKQDVVTNHRWLTFEPAGTLETMPFDAVEILPGGVDDSPFVKIYPSQTNQRVARIFLGEKDFSQARCRLRKL